MNPWRRKGLIDQEICIEHSIEMGMKQRALGHALDDLPELGLFHPISGQMEHNSWV